MPTSFLLRHAPLTALLAVLAAPGAAQTVMYSVRELELPSGAPYAAPHAINNVGTVVSNVSATHPSYINVRGTTVVMVQDVFQSWYGNKPWAINRYDEVAGEGQNPRRGYLWGPAEGVVNVGVSQAGFSMVHGINDRGDVAGHGFTGERMEAFVRYRDGRTVFLPRLPGLEEAYGAELDINDRGEVVGKMFKSGFYWTEADGIVDIGIPPGLDQVKWIRINNEGQIAGHVVNLAVEKAFFKKPGEAPFVLPDPPGYPVHWGWALNDHGHVVGIAGVRFPYTGVLWLGQTKGIHIPTRVDETGAGMTVAGAQGINDKGQIACWAYRADPTMPFPVVLTPHSTTFAPESFQIVRGRLDGGGVSSLAAEDGDSLRICRFILPNAQVAPIEVRFDGRLPWDPLYLWFRAKGRSTVAGKFLQTLDFWDWQTEAYDEPSAWTDPFGAAWSSQETIARSRMARFLGPGREVRVRARVRPNGPVVAAAWCVEWDLGVFEAVQPDAE